MKKFITKSVLLFKCVLFTFLLCSVCSLPGQTNQSNSPSSDNQTNRETFTVVAEPPSYDGGFDAFYKHIMKEIRYPLEARNEGDEGIVNLEFVIERNGSVSSVMASSDISDECINEVIRTVEQAPDFNPGSQRGRTVRVKMKLSINFILDPDKKNADNSPQGSIVIGELKIKEDKLQISADYKNGLWSGKITSKEGDAMPGANIIVNGTKYGTVSDRDGTFSVLAEQSQSIVVSFMGYESVRLEN